MDLNNFNRSSRYRTRFTVRFFAFLAFGLVFLTTSAFGADTRCINARANGIQVIVAGKRVVVDACRGRHIRSLTREAATVDVVSISGNITHQNGVRMTGVTLTLVDHNAGTTRSVLTDDLGEYIFTDVEWGHQVELTPSLTDYEFWPPSVIWEGIVESEIQNFIAVGPPPPPPTPPANQPILAWTNYFDNTPHSTDVDGMIGRDAGGNTYVVGTSAAECDQTDIVLFKTDANGNRVWTRTFDGRGHYQDSATDMAVDAGGNVYIAGYSYSDGEPGERSYDFVVLKYNADGDLVWTSYYGGNPGYDDRPLSLKMDGAGNIYVAGYSWGVGTFANYATVKYSPDGDQMWARRFAGGNGEILNEVEVDASGNVYVTGYSNNSPAGGSEDIVTIKYNAAGDQMWLNRYDSTTQMSDEGYALEVDAAGDVLVLGESYDFETSSTIIQKINGTSGATVWVRPVTVDPARGHYPTGIKLDPSGNLILTGMLDDIDYNVDSFIAKLDPEAAVQWARIYDGPADEDFDGDPQVTFDSDGNLYVALTSEGFANADIQVIKYRQTGETDWTYRFGNPFFGGDGMLDWQRNHAQPVMLLDAQGNLYVTGNSDIPGQSTDIVVFKLEPVGGLRAVPFDFDGDRKADISVFRPQNGTWYWRKSSNGTMGAVNWGLSGDRIVPADYDGDGKYDAAVYRDGWWYVMPGSGDGTFSRQFGIAADIPVPSDLDNDGMADLNVFRQGIWYSLESSTGREIGLQFGVDGDVPIPADYDGNRRKDIGVYRGGMWYLRYDDVLPVSSLPFGMANDKVVPADYDGDRKVDRAVFRGGIWYVWMSTTNAMLTYQWGLEGDVPVPADYDGDRRADFAVFRSGTWYISRSSDGGFEAYQFGLANDRPVPAAYVR